ncbi:hypothetical protein MXB_1356 [Myxobolus squamalis]|nr:hypothetical protein MXB_1356 [Myxobolus squamalis]
MPLLILLRSGPSETLQFMGLPERVLYGFLNNIEKEDFENMALIDKIYEEYNQSLIKLINERRKLGQMLDDIENMSID